MKSSTELLLGHAHFRISISPHTMPFNLTQGRNVLAWLEALELRISQARVRGQMVCSRCFELSPIDCSGECRLCRKDQ